jgi:hypothetical protein
VRGGETGGGSSSAMLVCVLVCVMRSCVRARASCACVCLVGIRFIELSGGDSKRFTTAYTKQRTWMHFRAREPSQDLQHSKLRCWPRWWSAASNRHTGGGGGASCTVVTVRYESLEDYHTHCLLLQHRSIPHTRFTQPATQSRGSRRCVCFAQLLPLTCHVSSYVSRVASVWSPLCPPPLPDMLAIYRDTAPDLLFAPSVTLKGLVQLFSYVLRVQHCLSNPF